jgi:GNAT superfamily N-acetyltransferase
MLKIVNASITDQQQLKLVKPDLTTTVIKTRLELQKQKKAEFLLLKDENQLLSFVLLKWFGKPTHPEYPDLENLFTRVDKRGKGYATRLLSACENLAKEKGYAKIGLAVNPDPNDPAYRLYAKLNYQHTGGEKYVDGVYQGVEDWVIDLEKNLI